MLVSVTDPRWSHVTDVTGKFFKKIVTHNFCHFLLPLPDGCVDLPFAVRERIARTRKARKFLCHLHRYSYSEKAHFYAMLPVLDKSDNYASKPLSKPFMSQRIRVTLLTSVSVNNLPFTEYKTCHLGGAL